jgi:hypothetical protein
MATHNAYVSGNDFKTGSVIALGTEAPQNGDMLTFNYLNDASTTASVRSASSNELEVQMGSEIWRLRPHAPSDGTVHNNPVGDHANFWTVQTRL